MSFTIPGIPGQFVGENAYYLKNQQSGKYLYYNGTECCEREWFEPERGRFQWVVIDDKVMTMDYSFVANSPPVGCGCPCNCGPGCTGCACNCGCPRGLPTPAPEPEPEPEVAPPAPEPEVEDVPVTRSAALIEEALNAKASETGAPTPDAPVEHEDEEVPDVEPEASS